LLFNILRIEAIIKAMLNTKGRYQNKAIKATAIS